MEISTLKVTKQRLADEHSSQLGAINRKSSYYRLHIGNQPNRLFFDVNYITYLETKKYFSIKILV